MQNNIFYILRLQISMGRVLVILAGANNKHPSSIIPPVYGAVRRNYWNTIGKISKDGGHCGPIYWGDWCQRMTHLPDMSACRCQSSLVSYSKSGSELRADRRFFFSLGPWEYGDPSAVYSDKGNGAGPKLVPIRINCNHRNNTMKDEGDSAFL